jgi:hypothetical protein
LLRLRDESSGQRSRGRCHVIIRKRLELGVTSYTRKSILCSITTHFQSGQIWTRDSNLLRISPDGKSGQVGTLCIAYWTSIRAILLTRGKKMMGLHRISRQGDFNDRNVLHSSPWPIGHSWVFEYIYSILAKRKNICLPETNEIIRRLMIIITMLRVIAISQHSLGRITFHDFEPSPEIPSRLETY